LRFDLESANWVADRVVEVIGLGSSVESPISLPARGGGVAAAQGDAAPVVVFVAAATSSATAPATTEGCSHPIV
jgi:hypothetical protein